MTTSIDTVRRVRPVERAVLPARPQVEPIEWTERAARRERRAHTADRGSQVRGRASGAARSCARPRVSERPGEWFWLASVAVLSCGFVVLLGLFGAGAGAGAPGGDGTAVVQVRAGDTLWGVAKRVAPDSDPRVVVHRIVELNGLGASSA